MTSKPFNTLPELARAWPATALPGYRDHPTPWATYSSFGFDHLPPIERVLDDELRWLCSEEPVPSSLADGRAPLGREADAQHLSALLHNLPHRVPAAMRSLMGSDEPRRRIRSATDCYLDLAQTIVPVSTGGHLVHFLSDSQFCLHWLLYVGEAGSEAVVATGEPFGFTHPELWPEDAEVRHTFVPTENVDACVCADSLSEFIYRYWIENEIFFRLVCDQGPLTSEQLRYLAHYPKDDSADSPADAAQVVAPASIPTPSLLARILRRFGS